MAKASPLDYYNPSIDFNFWIDKKKHDAYVSEWLQKFEEFGQGHSMMFELFQYKMVPTSIGLFIYIRCHHAPQTEEAWTFVSCDDW